MCDFWLCKGMVNNNSLLHIIKKNNKHEIKNNSLIIKIHYKV